MKKLSGKKRWGRRRRKGSFNLSSLSQEKRKEFDDVLMQEKNFFLREIYGSEKSGLLWLWVSTYPHIPTHTYYHPILKTHPAPLRKAPPKKMRGAIASFWSGGEGGGVSEVPFKKRRGWKRVIHILVHIHPSPPFPPVPSHTTTSLCTTH